MEKGRMEEVNSDCMKDLVDKLFPLDLMGVCEATHPALYEHLKADGLELKYYDGVLHVEGEAGFMRLDTYCALIEAANRAK